jgi:hypothetical protein
VTKLAEYRLVFQPPARCTGDFIGTLRTEDYDLRKVYEMCAKDWVNLRRSRGLQGAKVHLRWEVLRRNLEIYLRRDDDSSERVGGNDDGRCDDGGGDRLPAGSGTGADGGGGAS